MDDIQGINDIAQRLAHLPPMGISNDGVEIDLQCKKGSCDPIAIGLPLLNFRPLRDLPAQPIHRLQVTGYTSPLEAKYTSTVMGHTGF